MSFVDYRESKLISNGLDKSFVVQNLEIGDIVFKRLDGSYICIIERKTVSDYVSSISDGRLKNQAMRIAEHSNGAPVIYVIEGHLPDMSPTVSHMTGGVTVDALYSSIIGKLVRDKFSIFNTKSIAETVLFLHKVQKKISTINWNTTSVSTDMDYLRTIKITKKENMTPKLCYISQLAQIPGVSYDIAEKIYEKYSNMAVLINAYNTCNPIERCTMLSNICDKVGKVLSSRIYEYLMPPVKIQIKLSLKT